ncbi:MAG: hypothetical protein E7446_01185 [Ruminococcaceae bacterium]|nr:hypothetical protein [Oscillospiraceae bacterium]
MPTTKKRINLSIPDDQYKRLQAYKEKHGITSDATACLQLIIRQLNGLEQTEALFSAMKQFSVDQIMEISRTGLVDLKAVIDKEE